MYQSDTCLLSILQIWVCSQDCLAIGWLLAGHWLAMSQNGYTSRQSHILTMYQNGTWLQSILWTVVCSQDILAIGWLSAGHVPKSIHFQIVIYVPKWHMAAINTLNCSVFTRFLAIDWLLVGYWRSMYENQHTSWYSYILCTKLHMAAINTFVCSAFTRFMTM